jgi:hypothetical protein
VWVVKKRKEEREKNKEIQLSIDGCFLVFLGAISNFRESLFSSSRLASLRSAITSGLLFRHFDVRLGGCIEKRNKSN